MTTPESYDVTLPQQGCDLCTVHIPKVCLDLKDGSGRKEYDYTGTLPGHPNVSYAAETIEQCPIRPALLEHQADLKRAHQQAVEEKRLKLQKSGTVYEQGESDL